MTSQEVEEIRKKMKELTKKVSKSEKESKEFLTKTGIYTSTGSLKGTYK